ncbi:MAG: aromatic acid decarboxylase [Leptothrix sp. (in: Bacteria)]|nr:aromatic acid decarboxylase [Leptothrix sp. (in: b-proteobacteria)]
MNSPAQTPRRLVVGISGASGAIYGIRILQALQGSGIETHLVMTESARLTLAAECEIGAPEVEALASEVHHARNVGATIASGSFRTMGMVVAPCSIRTLSEIAWGGTSGLLTRAADVVLKERRRLVLMLRETPLHAGHIQSMLQATNNGAIVMPPVPAFYARPQTIDDIVNHSVGRVLDLFDIETDLVERWAGLGKRP